MTSDKNEVLDGRGEGDNDAMARMDRDFAFSFLRAVDWVASLKARSLGPSSLSSLFCLCLCSQTSDAGIAESSVSHLKR